MLALSGFAVLGEGGYGIEAVSMAKETEPDVVVIAVEAVADLLPQSPVVAYSSIKDPQSIRKAMLAGVSDYLVTPVREEDLISSIHGVLAQEERRQARVSGEMEEPVAAGTVLTVFGAKGGIGKTTLSTNLATALVQKTGQSVAIVDLDTRFGDVAILMDVPVERSIADLALPSQTYDYVILDTPGTFNDIVARALELATLVLLVATVDMASLKDTLLAIDMLRSWNFPQEKVKLVINATNEASNVQPQEVKRMLGREVYWSIPYDRNISTATQLGMPVVVAKPTSKASESMVEMAYTLSGIRDQQGSGDQKQGGKGLFGRILGSVTEEKTEVKVE
jgi:pilus assembly protein CpaE